MRLCRDLERMAQAGDLHRDEIFHHFAGAFHSVFALHHHVEVEIVDQADQQIGQLLVRAEYLGEALHFTLAFARLEIGELGEAKHFFFQRLELVQRRYRRLTERTHSLR